MCQSAIRTSRYALAKPDKRSVLTIIQIMQQLHDKLTRTLSPARSVDPLTVLPVELAEMVLEHLAFRNLVNCMRVSRGWRDYIAKLPRLWMHLDLSGARRPVPRKFVNQAVRRSQCRLTRLTIHRFEHVDMLKNLAKACKDLTEIEFISLPHAMSSTLVEIAQFAQKLEKFIVHPEITLDTANQILDTRKTLKHVGFNAIKRSQWAASWQGPYDDLETCNIHFQNPMEMSNTSLRELMLHTCNLKTLNFSRATVNLHFFSAIEPSNSRRFLSPLTTLVMRQVEFNHAEFPILPPTLQKLVIEYNGSFDLQEGGHDGNSGLMESRLSSLTHLALSDINGLSADRMERFLDLYVVNDQLKDMEDGTPLQSLSIHGVLHKDHYMMGGLFMNQDGVLARSRRILTPALQHLDIATLPVDDNEIEALLKHKTGITSIDISHTQITGASIKMLADGLAGIRNIKADNCPRINGRDAIEYARRKGIVVSCSMGEGNGSRRVRYG
jgi:F-box/TPR repeat protein Pof3